MRNILLYLLLLLLPSIASAQSTQAKVTLRNGTVIVGSVKEFDALDHITLIVAGSETTIPMSEVAYVDNNNPSNTADQNTKEATIKEEAILDDKLADFKGFLLARGNNVYVYCDESAASRAGANQIKTLLQKDKFWNVVDNMSDAHFTINYCASFSGRDAVNLSISSWRTSATELIALKNVTRLEQVSTNIYEANRMYEKHIVPLQEKIEKNKVSKIILKRFTIE